jgi:hypothetical protein
LVAHIVQLFAYDDQQKPRESQGALAGLAEVPWQRDDRMAARYD